MRIRFFLLLSCCLLFFACADKNRQAKNQQIDGISYSKDTAQVNRILQGLKDDNSVSSDSLRSALKIAEDLSRKAGYDYGLANMFFQYGNLSYWMNSYKEALNHFKDALKIAERINDNQWLAMIHQVFFPNLKKVHPDLSKTELKFCAYLKENLSDNQIASILNVTDEAILETRYRVRKKMNLTSQGSLEDYISKF